MILPNSIVGSGLLIDPDPRPRILNDEIDFCRLGDESPTISSEIPMPSHDHGVDKSKDDLRQEADH
jgi:hypothetical protein